MNTNDKFTVVALTLGIWEANCYIVGNNETNHAFVIDPGQGGASAVAETVEELGWTLDAVLLTHGHLDHLWAAPELANRFDLPVRLHEDDRWLWEQPGATHHADNTALKASFGLDWDPPTERLETIADHQTMNVVGLTVTVRHTPGHTPGSVVFGTDELDEAPVMFTGDLIFAGAVGRTDFPRSSTSAQNAALQRVILTADDRTVLAPGHGNETTVGHERRRNPFLQML